MFKRNNIFILMAYMTFTVGLSGCTSNADYWQRADVKEMIRFDSEYSQQILNRDISTCEQHLEQSEPQYKNFNVCMEDKGWQKIKNMSGAAENAAAKTYIQNEKRLEEKFKPERDITTYLNF